MRIRKRYIQVVEAIAEQAGASDAGANYHVSVEATRRECLAYTLKWVVRNTTQHYRYDLYRDSLSMALNFNASRMNNRSALLHLDLGSGPGLFTWVVRDALRKNPSTIEYYGYDHSSEMVSLADEIWSQLCKDIPAFWYHDPDEMLSTVSSNGPRYKCSLVTFGHVLAQTHDQDGAIPQFAKIIARTLAANCLVVAVDAKSASAEFQRGCKRLKKSLRHLKLQVDVLHRSERRFFANVQG